MKYHAETKLSSNLFFSDADDAFEMPGFRRGRPPYATVPLPPLDGELGQESTRLHPSLDFEYPLVYDLSLPPDYALSSQPLDDPAFDPPCSSLTITHKDLPWPIPVTAEMPGVAFVTLSDIFESLYRTLRLPVCPEEYYTRPAGDQKAIARAFFTRHARSPPEANEFSKGIRRVDFLCGRLIFRGLSSDSSDPNIWKLSVSAT